MLRGWGTGVGLNCLSVITMPKSKNNKLYNKIFIFQIGEKFWATIVNNNNGKAERLPSGFLCRDSSELQITFYFHCTRLFDGLFFLSKEFSPSFCGLLSLSLTPSPLSPSLLSLFPSPLSPSFLSLPPPLPISLSYIQVCLYCRLYFICFLLA